MRASVRIASEFSSRSAIPIWICQLCWEVERPEAEPLWRPRQQIRPASL